MKLTNEQRGDLILEIDEAYSAFYGNDLRTEKPEVIKALRKTNDVQLRTLHSNIDSSYRQLSQLTSRLDLDLNNFMHDQS